MLEARIRRGGGGGGGTSWAPAVDPDALRFTDDAREGGDEVRLAELSDDRVLDEME